MPGYRLPRGDILYLNRKPFHGVDFDMPVEVARVRFRNPFFVSSGPTTMLLSQLKAAAEHGWAGASVKLTFDPPPYINRRPRYGWGPTNHLLYFTQKLQPGGQAQDREGPEKAEDLEHPRVKSPRTLSR